MKYYIETITRNYFYFDGRARRREYWWFVLFDTIVMLLLTVADHYFGWIIPLEDSSGKIMRVVEISTTVYIFATAFPRIAITTRRLHDIGKSGWLQLILIIVPPIGWALLVIFCGLFQLLAFTPFVGWMILVVMCAQDGQRWDNQYGPNPKRRHRY